MTDRNLINVKLMRPTVSYKTVAVATNGIHDESGGRVMEHRLSKRVQGKLGLFVYKRGMPVATGQIRDASKRGLFISTDYTDVQLNQTLELEFRFPDNQEKQFRRLKAHVVRKSDKGLGVDFEGVENDGFTISSLVQWLKKHHVPMNYFPVRRQAY
ncbi:PilZ domain-containing protein [Marinobacter sp. HL-58]|uniref:PilZ domain-containing protein n=1 Tax=Marinobacter sp. HL-58 TaxID=1479237 RepID=UPI0025BCCDE8|nr:PilZ domain-containing protein [Marinobacter sp. HL-58]